MIHLRPDHTKTILKILRKYVPRRRLLVFGSRVSGKAKPYSDLDLAIIGKKPLSMWTLGSLREDFMASDLPFRVDIVDWAKTADDFRKIIRRNAIELK